MLVRRLPLFLFFITACAEPVGPGGDTPIILAVNGAALPLIAAGDTMAISGQGFGAAQGDGGVQLGSTPLAVLSWSGTGIVAVAPSTVTGTLSITTGTGAVLPALAIRARIVDTLSTDTRAWTAGTDLPVILRQASAAGIAFPTETGFSSLVVLSGGQLAGGALTDSTRIGTTNGTSTVTAWSSAPDTVVPIPRRLHAMVGASATSSRIATGGVAWMIGGIDSTGRTVADVLGIAVGSDGSYGFWTSLIPLPGDRAGAAATVGLGAIYVVGGFGTDSLARPDLVMATINPEGTINGWFRGPDLPVGVAFGAVAVVGDRLYLAGGETGKVHPDTSSLARLSTTVYSIRLSRLTGFFADSAWSIEPVTLQHRRARHALFAAAGGLVAVGGVLDSAAADTEAARIASGTLGAFQARTAPSRPGGPTYAFAGPVLRDGAGQAIVTVMGGQDAAGGSRAVWWH